jgi:hypothetical protein
MSDHPYPFLKCLSVAIGPRSARIPGRGGGGHRISLGSLAAGAVAFLRWYHSSW